jgi:hypothetical protein
VTESRIATSDEVDTWQTEGWVVLDGLVGSDEIDAAVEQLWSSFPTPEEYHADPDGTRTKWLGTPPPSNEWFTWPPDGPGFRPEQHRWRAEFPFSDGGLLNRLCTHSSIVDFAERALESTDLRLYQAQMSAKYTGEINYEQPMHADRNHSWLPAISSPPWRHMEAFLYLSDVWEDCAPTHLVPKSRDGGRSTNCPLYMPDNDGDLYAEELPAIGPKGSLLAYRADVFHRGVDITEPGGARFLLNASYRRAGQDWIGFHTFQSKNADFEWTTLVEESTPRELALYGFPEPGHEIWTLELVESTQELYPKMNLDPWREALSA